MLERRMSSHRFQKLFSKKEKSDITSFQVLVDAPCPDVKKENAFEDTMFLIDILRQTKEKENKQKKEDMIRNMALEQKRRMQKK